MEKTINLKEILTVIWRNKIYPVAFTVLNVSFALLNSVLRGLNWPLNLSLAAILGVAVPAFTVALIHYCKHFNLCAGGLDPASIFKKFLRKN